MIRGASSGRLSYRCSGQPRRDALRDHSLSNRLHLRHDSRSAARPTPGGDDCCHHRSTDDPRGELVCLPLVRGSARCEANSAGLITDGLGCVPGADVGRVRARCRARRWGEGPRRSDGLCHFSRSFRSGGGNSVSHCLCTVFGDDPRMQEVGRERCLPPRRGAAAPRTAAVGIDTS